MIISWVSLLGLLSAGVLVDAGTSYASSYSYSGGAPVTYTSTSGSGTAYASAGPYNPYAYYNSYYNRFPAFPFLPFIFPPYIRIGRSINRSDSAQQMLQVRIPPGLVVNESQQEVAAHSAPAGIAQQPPTKNSVPVPRVEKSEDSSPNDEPPTTHLSARDGISGDTLVLGTQTERLKPELLPPSSGDVVDNIPV